MSFPIHLTEEAFQEKIEAFLFYEDQQAGLGERFLNELVALLQKVAVHQPIILIQMKRKRLETLVL
jgi:uncharacterized protein YpbB